MKNRIEDLRNHLFATLEELRDPENKLSVERAQLINQTAQTIINTAKVELQFMELTGSKGTGFVPQDQITGSDATPLPRRLGKMA